ncbi:hypothetical protein ACLB2K_040867 [Fragaria x ananassa]
MKLGMVGVGDIIQALESLSSRHRRGVIVVVEASVSEFSSRLWRQSFRRGFVVVVEASTSSLSDLELFLCDRLLQKKVVFASVLLAAMTKVWRLKEKVDIHEVEGQIFQFQLKRTRGEALESSRRPLVMMVSEI